MQDKQTAIEKESSKENEFKDFSMDDILNNIIVIKTFGTEIKEINKLNKNIQENVKKNQYT